jgi:hypothetical protein
MSRLVQTRILEELQGFPRGLSDDALAIRLELDPVHVRQALGVLYANSKVEAHEDDVYRVISRHQR